MKKLTILLIAIISAALIFTFAGCSEDKNFTAQAYSSAASQIDAITIDVKDREIAVSASGDNQIHIDYFESEKEFYNIAVSEDKILKMELSANKEWHDFIGTKVAAEYRKIDIKIPHALLSSLTITTTNENIKLSQIMVTDSLALSCNGGNIEFEQISVGKALTLTTKNGNITGTVIGSYDAFSIACKIKKGDCNLPLQKSDGDKSLTASCNNGNIKIDFVTAPLLSI